VAQCADKSDEAHCCDVGEFYCTITGLCVPETVLCDGLDNCGDQSDENPDLCVNRDNNSSMIADKSK